LSGLSAACLARSVHVYRVTRLAHTTDLAHAYNDLCDELFDSLNGAELEELVQEHREILRCLDAGKDCDELLRRRLETHGRLDRHP
jgi:hypothetical protein